MRREGVRTPRTLPPHRTDSTRERSRICARPRPARPAQRPLAEGARKECTAWLSGRPRSSSRASPTCTCRSTCSARRSTTTSTTRIIRPSINCIAMTYELAAQPEYEDLMLATSHLTGKKVNRFTHIHQSTEDLSKKVKMQRLLGQKTGSCFQRCVGMDAINALYSVTYEIDQARGTDYHERFKKYVQYLQDERPRRRRRHDRPQGRPLPGAAPAARPRHVRARRREARRRHRGARRQGAPDRRLQLARDHRHAHHRHARGRRGLRRQLQLPGERRGRLLHLRPPELRHAQARGQRPRRRQHALRRPGSADGLRRRVRPLGPRLHVRRDRVLRRARRALRRLPPPELRRLQGRRRRRAHRRRRHWPPTTTASPRPATSRTSSSR